MTEQRNKLFSHFIAVHIRALYVTLVFQCICICTLVVKAKVAMSSMCVCEHSVHAYARL